MSKLVFSVVLITSHCRDPSEYCTHSSVKWSSLAWLWGKEICRAELHTVMSLILSGGSFPGLRYFPYMHVLIIILQNELRGFFWTSLLTFFLCHPPLYYPVLWLVTLLSTYENTNIKIKNFNQLKSIPSPCVRESIRFAWYSFCAMTWKHLQNSPSLIFVFLGSLSLYNVQCLKNSCLICIYSFYLFQARSISSLYYVMCNFSKTLSEIY